MKSPSFSQTIGFKLALWYTALIVVFGILMIFSINFAMWQARAEIPPRFIGSSQTPFEVARLAADRYVHQLRTYSLISFAGLSLIGGLGGYMLSKKMLEPVDRVTTLAKKISTANLKDRIAYQGPDDEMKRLADTFDGMLARLENAFETQNQFIQDASHELRTPIAIARTNIDVLEMETRPSVKDYKHVIEILKLSIDRMSKLNDKLLILSRNNPEVSSSSAVNVGQIIDELVEEFETSSIGAGVRLEKADVAPDLYIRADSLALKQVVSNLVDNAIRYNRPGGSVKVAAGPGDNCVFITVADTGIGISKADSEHIFERFYRVDKSRSRAAGGSGLGLAVVKKIVENLGGRIEVETAPGKGSSFTIYLPQISL